MNIANLSAATTILKYQRSEEREKNVKFDTITSSGIRCAMITVACRLHTWWVLWSYARQIWTKCTGIMKCIQEATLQRNNERTEKKQTTETQKRTCSMWRAVQPVKEKCSANFYYLLFALTSGRLQPHQNVLFFSMFAKIRFRLFWISLTGILAVNHDVVEMGSQSTSVRNLVKLIWKQNCCVAFCIYIVLLDFLRIYPH